jgi:PAS domain S-box-containing protein
MVGDGDVRALMRKCNWSATPLGPPEAWPQSLRAAVRVMLTSRFAMWMAWGPELTFLCNDAYLPTVGIKRDWVIGSRSDKVWAEIWPDIGPRIRRVLETGEATWDEALLLYLERSGFTEETYHTFSYSPLADDAGATSGMLCVVAEVTEKVIGERQLATLRDLGARLAAASTRSEVMSSLQTCLAAEPRDLPFALAYLADRNKLAVELACVHGLDRENPTVRAIASVEATAQGWPPERARGGEAVEVDVDPAAVQGMPLQHWQKPPTRALVAPVSQAEGGAPVGYFVAGLNPHRALDAGYRGFLELLTAQLAAAIARADEFERERERAEALAEIDRAKTAFFSNVSHEFRTPLTLMLGPLEDALAEASNLSASQRERLDAAHRNALRLLRLVNSLLDFSRIEAGRVQVSYRPTDLAALTADLASSFRSATDRAKLSLVVDTPPLSQPVYVDRDMWEKIVLNLLSNAFKFTFEGEIAVELRETEGSAQLAVRDTGTGIPAHELPKLFDRFHRVDGAQGRSFEGSGIGLALVQELVKQHGGEIATTSEVGKGTTFTISIPLGVAHLPPDRIAAGAPADVTAIRARSYVEEALRWLPAEQAFEALLETGDAQDEAIAATSPIERRSVLLADDNADLRSYIARLLSERGYAVTTVADGAAALAAAQSAKPDLLVTDVMMPKLDGFGLLRAVRADETLRDLPVIMLSGRAGEDAKVEGLDAGADDYLTKPFSARELLARVAGNIAMSRLRREAAAAIRASEAEARVQAERVQLALDAGAIVGTWVWDVVEDRVVADERFARSFGVDAERIRAGAPLSTIMESIHEDDRAEVAETIAEALGRGGAYRSEYRVRQSDGVYRWIEANGRVDLDESGIPTRFPGVLIDIDHRRRIEEELRRLNEELEARVARAIREREDAEAALRQSQKMEAVGQLTGGIAHDFNNLLTIISGNVDTARRALASNETARVGRALANALQGAERAATLTQRLLAFSRRQPLAPKPIDADRLVAGMSDLLNRALGETIQLEVVSTPGLWRTEADPNQLENAILNLAVNARDAMPKGGKLTIETANANLDKQYSATHAEVAPGDYVVIAVTDTGLGMSRETLARVFDPFFTTKEVGKGTGLGLSMVYGFVKQSGGHVKIYSEPGEGTTVRIYLPRMLRDGEAREETSYGAEATSAKASRTILVVEDDGDVRSYTVEIIRELGYRVLEAHDGPAALRLLKREDLRIDLLFTDVVMPGMSGRELADKAREIQPDLLVLYTSGYTRNSIVHGGRLDSGVEMIAKPFTYQSLSAKIAEVIDAGRSNRVLVVDEDPSVRKFLIETLEGSGFAVHEAATASEALGLVRAAQGRYDLVLIDAERQAKGGDALARELRAMLADLPLLIAVRENDEELLARLSADRRTGVIRKPYDAQALHAAMKALGLTGIR